MIFVHLKQLNKLEYRFKEYCSLGITWKLTLTKMQLKKTSPFFTCYYRKSKSIYYKTKQFNIKKKLFQNVNLIYQQVPMKKPMIMKKNVQLDDHHRAVLI